LCPVAKASFDRAVLEPLDPAQDPAGSEGVHFTDDRPALIEGALELGEPALRSSADR